MQEKVTARDSDLADWNQDYLSGNTPWETDHPSPELVECVDRRMVSPGRVFEMGCGTGQNAVFLAKRGFCVTAVDCSQIALSRARQLAGSVNVSIRFLEADVRQEPADIDPVDFVLDRSCYEFLRDSPSCCEGYLRTLNCITRVGSKFLLILRQSRKERLQDLQVSGLLSELGGHWELEQLMNCSSQLDCKL